MPLTADQPIFIALRLVLVAIIGYLWGSLPPGYWMGKILRGRDFDIRNYGSRKTGATNVNRVLGLGPAIIVMILDLSKGILPMLLAVYVPFFYVLGWGPLLAGLAALIGHRHPIFIGFQGGRGVLTGAGSLLFVAPPVSFLIFGIGAAFTISTIALSRYVSLGSLVGCVTVMICGVVFGLLGWLPVPAMLFMIVAPLLVIIFHSDNIERLLAGKERKLGQKEVVASPGGAASSR
jgi:glycerol-3-phosphate acyltransferase PlsY